MRVLVTGAMGFLGQHVVHALDEKGHDVRWFDIRGERENHADITKPLPRFPGGIDAVIHLAAMAAPRECDAHPDRAMDVNVNGTHQVLKMALESGAKKFVFSSSAHVYGITPRYLPTPESHPLWLLNTYTLTKILGEQLCQMYFDNHGLSYTTLRLYNAYGPGQSLGYFIPDMAAKAKAGKFHLSGSNTTKDFVYIEDVASAFVAAVETPFVGYFNIGTGTESTLGSVAARIADVYGAEFSCDPENHYEVTRMQADVSRAKRILGWEPKVTIAEGLDALFAADKIAA